MRNIARRVMRVRKTHRETLENAQEARAGLTKSTALLSKRRGRVARVVCRLWGQERAAESTAGEVTGSRGARQVGLQAG